MAKRRVCEFMVSALIRMARLAVGLATVLAASRLAPHPQSN
ncbi:MAG TPA: hypothetical protein VLB32_08195 [Candidatus Acidoferrales bacterium]|nr:hypothetical protein [Candidatus Acidoferrales bacterium]